jgi:hypothetical protein
MQVAFRPVKWERTGVPGKVTLVLPDGQLENWRKVAEMFADGSVSVTFAKDTAGTYDQQKAFYILVRAIAQAAFGEEAEDTLVKIKYALYSAYSPSMILNDGRRIPKSIGDMDKTERSKFLDAIINHLIELGVEASSVAEVGEVLKWWRKNKSASGSESYSGINDYRQSINYCESCLKTEGLQVAHIRSRGAGGSDSADNILVLCHQCHIATQHQEGWDALLLKAPHLTQKVRKILGKAKGAIDG